jgi:hypothetical protein
MSFFLKKILNTILIYIFRLEENNKYFKQSAEEKEWIDDLFEIPSNK